MPRRFLLGLLFFLAIGATATQINTPATQAYTPAQRDQGAQVFMRRCSTCHGDKGQGLTLEWRQTWPKEDQNCSTPKCHGGQHPPDGFEIKDNYAPAIIGPGTLARFQTAQDLYSFVSSRMPMQAPGILSQDDYWALTAFLLDAHGVSADGANLDATTASLISLQGDKVPASAASTAGWWPAAAGTVLVLALLAAAGLALRRARVRGD